MAVGNPLVKERVETANELSRCLTLQRKPAESRISMETELPGMPGKKPIRKRPLPDARRILRFTPNGNGKIPPPPIPKPERMTRNNANGYGSSFILPFSDMS